MPYQEFNYRSYVFPPSTSETKTFSNRQTSFKKLRDEGLFELSHFLAIII